MVTTDDELYTEDTEIPKAMEEVKSDCHPQTRKRLYITKELQTNLTGSKPTSGGAVTADSSCCANCVEPPRPSAMGARFTQGSVLSPVLFNIYTNDQPIHKDTRSFIYADDLCIATQDASFEKTESALSADKTQTCVFHLRNRKANRQLNISWCGKKLEHTPSPIYLGVTLDRTLSYSTHIAKVKAKTAARNNVLRKLANSKWGTHPSTIKTTALALCYSTAEYACPVWERLAHAHKVD